MSGMPECSVPTSTSSGDMVNSSLSPGNRHIQSPPPGADLGTKGKEGEEPAVFYWVFLGFFFLSPVKAIHFSV